MREFFKPWRRKAGVVTLVMACLFAAGWVRSFGVTDVWFKSTSALVTFQGYLQWSSFEEGYKIPFQWKSYHGDARRMVNQELLISEKIESPDMAGLASVIRVSYAAIVIPMSILSAYLLLAKPRPPAPKTTEPAPATGT